MMIITGPLRGTVLVAWRSKRIWLLQFALNPIFISLAVAGLIVPEAHIWQLLVSVLLAITILLGMLWLQSATLLYFADYHAGEARLVNAFRTVWHTLLPFAAWAAVLSACLLLVSAVSAHELQFASYIHSILPAGIRKVLTEVRVDRFFVCVSWWLFWIVLPGLFLPLGLQIAKHGVHGLSGDGWKTWSRIVHRFWYWITFILLTMIGVWIPHALVNWHPPMPNLTGEIASLCLRLLLGWLLAVTAWVVLTSALGWFNAEGEPEISLPAGEVIPPEV